MPKISADTIAEHRAHQHAALIQAGAEVLGTAGVDGLTPRAVCEKAGLSRSSFYDYFSSKDDLLVAIAIQAFDAWDTEVEQALKGTPPGLEELHAFVHVTMRMAADGKHDLAGTLREAHLHPSRVYDLVRLHATLLRPILRVLSALDHPDPNTAAWLVHGTLSSGIELIGQGAAHDAVAEQVYALLTHGIVSADQ